MTKALHNGLQGRECELTDEMAGTYRAVTGRNAATVTDEYDVVVLHDPQPLGTLDVLADRFPESRFVWRCHLELTSPARSALEFVGEYVLRVDHVVVSRTAYADVIDTLSSGADAPPRSVASTSTHRW